VGFQAPSQRTLGDQRGDDRSTSRFLASTGTGRPTGSCIAENGWSGYRLKISTTLQLDLRFGEEP
jgi:hypothetical protein